MFSEPHETWQNIMVTGAYCKGGFSRHDGQEANKKEGTENQAQPLKAGPHRQTSFT
jgi:hypothetical protein